MACTCTVRPGGSAFARTVADTCALVGGEAVLGHQLNCRAAQSGAWHAQEVQRDGLHLHSQAGGSAFACTVADTCALVTGDAVLSQLGCREAQRGAWHAQEVQQDGLHLPGQTQSISRWSEHGSTELVEAGKPPAPLLHSPGQSPARWIAPTSKHSETVSSLASAW